MRRRPQSLSIRQFVWFEALPPVNAAMVHSSLALDQAQRRVELVLTQVCCDEKAKGERAEG